jgi:hypothetical protein
MVVDGVVHALQYPNQAAAILGMGGPSVNRDAWRMALDINTIVEGWLALASKTPWPALLVPGVTRGRTPLALTIDALIGISALADAVPSAWFHWPGNPKTNGVGDRAGAEYQACVAGRIFNRADLLLFAEAVADRWRLVLAANVNLIQLEPERLVNAPRGELALVELLEAQRLHAAQHYRQAIASLEAQGIEPEPIDLSALDGLRLPSTLDE